MPDQDIEDAVRGLMDRGDAGTLVAIGWEHIARAHPDEMMTQYDVQAFLWTMLPAWLRKPDELPQVDWREVVEAAAEFFDALDQPRYAEICRSPRTAAIVAASTTDEERYQELLLEGIHDSGVVPPRGLRIEWLDDDERGPMEATLHTTITKVLEQAVVNGELDPADDNAKIQMAASAMELVPEEHTESIHDLFLTERVEWFSRKAGSATLRELLVRVRPYLVKQLDLTAEGLIEGVRHIGQLLNHLATEGAEGVAKQDLPPHDSLLRANLKSFGLVAEVDGRVRATERGERVLDHPVLVFDAVCTGLMHVYRPFHQKIAMPLFAMLMLSDEVDFPLLSERIAVVLEEMGVFDDEGRRVDEDYLDDAILSALDDLEALRIISDDETRLVTPYGKLIIHSVLVWRLKRGEIVVP